VIDAVERAEMSPEHAALDELLLELTRHDKSGAVRR